MVSLLVLSASFISEHKLYARALEQSAYQVLHALVYALLVLAGREMCDLSLLVSPRITRSSPNIGGIGVVGDLPYTSFVEGYHMRRRL